MLYPMTSIAKPNARSIAARRPCSPTTRSVIDTYQLVDLEEAVPVTALLGDLDLSARPAVDRELTARAAGLRPGEVMIIDLTRLRFLDVGGARALRAVAEALRRRGVGLVLRGPTPLFHLVLRVVGVERAACAVIPAPPELEGSA